MSRKGHSKSEVWDYSLYKPEISHLYGVQYACSGFLDVLLGNGDPHYVHHDLQLPEWCVQGWNKSGIWGYSDNQSGISDFCGVEHASDRHFGCADVESTSSLGELCLEGPRKAMPGGTTFLRSEVIQLMNLKSHIFMVSNMHPASFLDMCLWSSDPCCICPTLKCPEWSV